MVHACVACALRFSSTGELRDHIETDHVLHPPVEPVHSTHQSHTLSRDSYTRSGWATPPHVEPTSDQVPPDPL